MREVRVFLPAWVRALELEHPLKAALYSALRENAAGIACLADAEPALRRACELEQVCGCRIADVDLGSGTVTCELEFREGLFYQILSERTGFSVGNDGQLLRLLTELAAMKREYDKISAALDEVRATGYGIVMPCLLYTSFCWEFTISKISSGKNSMKKPISGKKNQLVKKVPLGLFRQAASGIAK